MWGRDTRYLTADDMNRSQAHRINGLPSQPSGFARCPLLDTGAQPKRAGESRKPGKPCPKSHLASPAVMQARLTARPVKQRQPEHIGIPPAVTSGWKRAKRADW
jgi:hypothetical protein